MERVLPLSQPVHIRSAASCVGRAEHEGPYGRYFDFHDTGERFGRSTWETAEAELSHAALSLALNKAGMSHRDVDLLVSGDLQNQCVASSEGHLEEQIPFLGIYGACSTCTEGILIASLALNAAHDLGWAAVVTTSHNSAAERQFRTPIEYGGQRPPTAQWTATAGGAFLLSRTCPGPAVTRVMPGVMVDGGVTDAFNMGAAMAPAAARSIAQYLSLTNTVPEDYDAIVTGDLGREGSALLEILLREEQIQIAGIHRDCGAMIYDPDKTDCHSGGSGCGCSAALLASYFLPMLERGEFRRILFLSTGALMSPSQIKQGGHILGVAPVIELTGGTPPAGARREE